MTASPLLFLSTGGTIASTDSGSGLVPTLRAADLATHLGVSARVHDLAQLDSSRLTLREVDMLLDALQDALADPTVEGIVLTHGTDSLEETAAAIDAQHTDPRPIILTGAMRPADHPHPDGPGNLAAAAAAALDPAARGGVYVAFGGALHAARGLRKTDTSSTQGFSSTGGKRRTVPRARLSGTRVDIVYAYPGAPGDLIAHSVAAGAHGIVVAGLGAGNVGDDLAQAMADCPIPLVMSTRVPHGGVSACYGGAGGFYGLSRRGIMSAGALSPAQARMYLLCALASQQPPESLL